MKSVLDGDFKYKPSFDTDVRKTFERVRRERTERDKRDAENKREAEQKTRTLRKTG